ncbi:hypothetical protein DFA_04931 [Cavenderia fasciculata]|uniref:Uncharacterized protein n=1 Tax=Cavenderia fasciculata TaxID=261658 RepID=F4PMF1_CACFS|nr:uncharacterized protein DFA_04931 [Cavenderia fasciculata]EGG22801.1 hypothetical protein DFA_04931 [Cavenderia fasciculata]|eukprot:XP_004360652.1 hypothetical protein DFA_04931 [Cavenderia fasciculata]
MGTTPSDWTCNTLPTLPGADSKAPGVYTMFSAVPKRVTINSITGSYIDIDYPLMYIGSSYSSVYDRIQKKKNVDGFCTDATQPGKAGTCLYCYKTLPLPNQDNNPDAYLIEQIMLSMFCSLTNAVHMGGVQYDVNCQFAPGQGYLTVSPMGWLSHAGINLNGGFQDALLNARCNYPAQVPQFQNAQQHEAWEDQFEIEDMDDGGLNTGGTYQADGSDLSGKMTPEEEAKDLIDDSKDQSTASF